MKNRNKDMVSGLKGSESRDWNRMC
uniref:Uncharacterized protein n=1 Tax=Anguilla anguilla TaxID=7936 RepID=A0A0E9V1V7_ANGAN